MPLPSYYPSAELISSVTTYEYDDAHNRVERLRDGVATEYSYNNLNQMTGYTEAGASVSYSYDANGNRQTRQDAAGTDTYEYDYENRLAGVSKGGVTYTYTYDYRARRVERVEGGTATKIVFSGGTSVQEYAGAGVQAEYVRGSDYGGGIGGLLYSLRAGVPSYTHYNNRGDVVAKTGTSGEVTWQAAYEAFGKRPAETGTTADRQKASTKEEDPTGLLNEGFRYRDLQTGEFITRDPAGFVDGPNLYAYVGQNPWSKFDPEGLKTIRDYEKEIDNAKAERDFNLRQLKREGKDFTPAERETITRRINDKCSDVVSKSARSIAAIKKVAHYFNEALDAAGEVAADVTRLDASTLDDSSVHFQRLSSDMTKAKAFGFLLSAGLVLIGGKLAKAPGVKPLAPAAGTGFEKQLIIEGNDGVLAVIKDGRIIAQTRNLSLSHADFVKRELGVVPEGAEVVTIGKFRGKIEVQKSVTFHGSSLPASQEAYDAANKAFQ